MALIMALVMTRWFGDMVYGAGMALDIGAGMVIFKLKSKKIAKKSLSWVENLF